MNRAIDEREDALRRMAERLLRSRRPDGNHEMHSVLWDADFFKLNQVARFRDADGAKQTATLAGAAEGLLSESWCIERSGIVFCAKMTLLAESLDEQRVFALIGADEATHSAWLEPWIDAHARGADPFSRFIADLVAHGNPQPLAFLLQVVLEGFGIVHYGGLAKECRDKALASAFKRMAQDEALHHAAGLAAFRADRLSETDKRFLVDGSQAFLQMVRCGPQSVIASLDRAIGASNQADIAGLFIALESESQTQAKLDRLRQLMTQPGMEWLIDNLQEKGLFTPCNANECAQLYTSMR